MPRIINTIEEIEKWAKLAKLPILNKTQATEDTDACLDITENIHIQLSEDGYMSANKTQGEGDNFSVLFGEPRSLITDVLEDVKNLMG